MKEVSDEVSVSCAAIIRKLIWSTMSWVDSSAPSSWVARQSCENRSSPPFGAADRNLLGEIGDDAFAARDAARHLGAGQGLSDHRDEAATISTKARVISSTSGPISAPRNEVAARSSVSCFIAG